MNPGDAGDSALKRETHGREWLREVPDLEEGGRGLLFPAMWVLGTISETISESCAKSWHLGVTLGECSVVDGDTMPGRFASSAGRAGDTGSRRLWWNKGSSSIPLRLCALVCNICC